MRDHETRGVMSELTQIMDAIARGDRQAAGQLLPQVYDELRQLAAQDPQWAALVNLRYFAGLTNKQAAEALSIAPRTADHHWAYARAWLLTELRDPSGMWQG